jgi:hypothetical protein
VIDSVDWTLLGVPPSLNRVGSRGSFFAWQRTKKRWQTDIEVGLMASALPRPCRFVRAYASLRFPVSRRRDAGNYQALLEKATGDALVNGGWLPDDTPEYFRFEDLRFERDLGPKRTTLQFVYET